MAADYRSHQQFDDSMLRAAATASVEPLEPDAIRWLGYVDQELARLRTEAGLDIHPRYAARRPQYEEQGPSQTQEAVWEAEDEAWKEVLRAFGEVIRERPKQASTEFLAGHYLAVSTVMRKLRLDELRALAAATPATAASTKQQGSTDA